MQGQNKETEPMEQTHLFTNELIHETSPYLLQHAHNPVIGILGVRKHFKSQRRLVIISIGYAACHWCHVIKLYVVVTIYEC
jgi:uncharacterized protein YyaL (SSP411 family)